MQLDNAERSPVLSSDYQQEKSTISGVAVFQAKLPFSIKLSAEFSSIFPALHQAPLEHIGPRHILPTIIMMKHFRIHMKEQLYYYKFNDHLLPMEEQSKKAILWSGNEKNTTNLFISVQTYVENLILDLWLSW